MEQRAKSINANFYTAFAIEKGMVVLVDLPLHKMPLRNR